MRIIAGTPSARCWACCSCPVAPECFPGVLASAHLLELERLVEHTVPVHAGGLLFRQGDPFQYITVIRLGMVKTYAVGSRRARADPRLPYAGGFHRSQRHR